MSTYILDANAIIDLFGGRGIPDLEAGYKNLEALAKKHTLVTTSTVLKEISNADAGDRSIPKDWFENTNTVEVIETEEFSGKGGGERSIQSIMDPDYIDLATNRGAVGVDPDVSRGYYDSTGGSCQTKMMCSYSAHVIIKYEQNKSF